MVMVILGDRMESNGNFAARSADESIAATEEKSDLPNPPAVQEPIKSGKTAEELVDATSGFAVSLSPSLRILLRGTF